jgi:hypothetical protein
MASLHQLILGFYSAVPRSLGIAAPSDIFSPGQLATLIAQAQSNLTFYAEQYSNGNPALAKGIEAQHQIALALYQRNKQLPLEMNAGTSKVLQFLLHISNCSRVNRTWVFRPYLVRPTPSAKLHSHQLRSLRPSLPRANAHSVFEPAHPTRR